MRIRRLTCYCGFGGLELYVDFRMLLTDLVLGANRQISYSTRAVVSIQSG